MSQSRPWVRSTLPLSAAGHLALIAAVVLIRFEPAVIEVRSPSAAFAWLTVQPREAAPSPSQAERDARRAETKGPDPAPAREEPSAAPRDPLRSSESPAGEALPAIPASPSRPAAVDWARQRADAIKDLLDEQAREERFATFTIDDAIPEPEPKRDAAPTGEIFSEHNTPARAALAPGQQRTALARRLVDLCHALTGGFGVALQGVKVLTLCAPDGGRSDLFAAIKPDYLKKLPDCDEGDEPPAAPGVMLAKCTLEVPAYPAGAPNAQD